MSEVIFRRCMKVDLFTRGTDLDWRDKNSYVEHMPLRSRELAWEFLRRNNEYRNDFEEYAEQVRRKGIDSATAFEERLCAKYGLSMRFGLMNPYLLSPPLFVVEDSLPLLVLRHWCKEGDPLKASGKIGDSQCPEYGKQGTPMRRDAFGFPEDVGDPDYPCFDVRISAIRPLEEQINDIKRHYEEVRKKSGFAPQKEHVSRKGKEKKILTTKQFNFENFVTYLRILDATNSKIGPSEIVQTIKGDTDGYLHDDPKNTKINDDKKAALHLARKGYQDLAARQCTFERKKRAP